VINALAKLCADERNTLFVVSGDSQENVENAIGNIPGLGLAASNGACFSLPNNGSLPREWKYFDLGVDWDAVKKVSGIRQFFPLRH
jgi:trehalose 6-phosphate synthase/phosphatase